MELPTIFIFTHEAMGDGEDGPTHQPVEHLPSLRAVPGLITLRPGDANEVVEAYRYVMQLRHKPAVLALTRQASADAGPKQVCASLPESLVAPTCWRIRPGEIPEVILMATGSELILAVEAHEQLTAEGIRWRVVSMPSWEIFEHQTLEYRRKRASQPNHCAGGGGAGFDVWMGTLHRPRGPHHRYENVRGFAPLKELQRKYGFEPENVASAARAVLGKP